jgi:Tfp pilus assembly protein PilV
MFKKELSKNCCKIVKASTLVEVLVALLLISIAFTLAATLYMQILESSKEKELVQARLYINNLWQTTDEFQNVYHRDGIHFKVRSGSYSNTEKLTKVEISAYGKDSTLLTRSYKILSRE